LDHRNMRVMLEDFWLAMHHVPLSLETLYTLLLLSAIDLVIFSLYISYGIIIYLSDVIGLNYSCMPVF
jgi:hypothetical protein